MQVREDSRAGNGGPEGAGPVDLGAAAGALIKHQLAGRANQQSVRFGSRACFAERADTLRPIRCDRQNVPETKSIDKSLDYSLCRCSRMMNERRRWRRWPNGGAWCWKKCRQGGCWCESSATWPHDRADFDQRE